MGVGRNLFYKKELFTKSGGYNSHQQIASGDDDLFISHIASSAKVSVNLDDYTYSVPKQTWSSLIQQKRRHLTTSTSYPLKHKIILSTIFLSQWAFYSISIYFCLINSHVFLVVFAIILRALVILIVSYHKMSLFSEKRLWYWVPILDFMLMNYYVLMGVMMLIKNRRW